MQFTVINGVKSEHLPVTTDIPQGSVQGPTLITFFTKAMPSAVSSGLCLGVLTILRSTALDSLQINLYRKSSMIIFIFILGVSLVTVRRMIVSGEARESCN